MTSDRDLLAQIYQTSLAWAQLGAETTTLRCGKAIMNPAFPEHHEGNCLWDAHLNGHSAEECLHEVESLFSNRGRTCFGWTPTLDQSPAALASVLERAGYASDTSLAMVLDKEPALSNLPKLEMLSARINPDLFRAVYALPGQRHSPMMGEVNLAKLTSPTLELYTALLNGIPVGRIGLLTVGDIGRVKNVFVGGDNRRSGCASAMLAFIADQSVRLGCRLLCLEVSDDNEKAIPCYERAGYRVVGMLPSFSR